MKKCTKCKEHKELTEFYKKTHSKDGLQHYCKACKSAEGKRWREENFERQNANVKRWKEENSERNKANLKHWYKKNSEYEKVRVKRWREENIERHRRNSRCYMRERRKVDPDFRIKQNLRCRLWLALKGENKSESTMELIGCDTDHLWEHLIAQFTEGMTVENYGEWHLDHIKPCASFDLRDEQQKRECFHYTNLQPLWAEDNYKKGDRYDG